MVDKQTLIKTHMHLASSLARKNLGKMRGFFTLEDLVSIGLETLWKCSEKWSETKNVTFGLYATICIQRAFSVLAFSVQQDKYKVSLLSMWSVDKEDEEVTWDFAADICDAPSTIARKQFARKARHWCARLPRHQRELIKLRYDQGETLLSAGKTLGFSKQRAQQVETLALKSLKAKALSAGYNLLSLTQ